MKIDMRDKRNGWLIVSYIAKNIRQARERLRQILRHEERKRDEFLNNQAEVRERAKTYADFYSSALGSEATPEQRKAIKELQALSRIHVEWDEHGIDYKQSKAESRKK